MSGVYSHKLSFSFLAAFPMNNLKYVALSLIDQPLAGVHDLNLVAETRAPMVYDIIAHTALLLGVGPDFG